MKIKVRYRATRKPFEKCRVIICSSSRERLMGFSGDPPPLDASMVEKQLSLLRTLGILKPQDIPRRHKPKTLLLPSPEAPTLVPVMRTAPQRTAESLQSTSIQVQRKREHKQPAIDEYFNCWRALWAHRQRKRTATCHYATQTTSALFAQWRVYTVIQQRHALQRSIMQMWCTKQYLLRWVAHSQPYRQSREWCRHYPHQTTWRLYVRIRIIIREWHLYQFCQRRRHQAFSIIARLAQRHYRSRCWLLLLRYRCYRRHTRSTKKVHFHAWHVHFRNQADFRFYREECIESMETFILLRSLRQWRVHFQGAQMASRDERRILVWQLQCYWRRWAHWRRTKCAFLKLESVAHQMLLARVLRAWKSTTVVMHFQDHWTERRHRTFLYVRTMKTHNHTRPLFDIDSS
jgi:hypothetical protein